MSKFLRQMTALSKKPSDFQKPQPSSGSARAEILAPKAGAATLSTVGSLSTVDNLSTGGKASGVDKLAIDQDGRPVNPALCKPAALVQHGHTPGEHAIYMSLWNLGGTPERRDEFRDVSIGYDKLAALVGGSKRNVQRLTESLLRKLAIQIIRAEDSGIRQGKTYRVYSMTEILRRRREVGYTWVLRNRSAVELVKMSTVDTLPTVDKLPTVVSLPSVGKVTTDTVDSLSTGTVDKLSTPLGTSFLGIKQKRRRQRTTPN